MFCFSCSRSLSPAFLSFFFCPSLCSYPLMDRVFSLSRCCSYMLSKYTYIHMHIHIFEYIADLICEHSFITKFWLSNLANLIGIFKLLIISTGTLSIHDGLYNTCMSNVFRCTYISWCEK